MKKIYTIVLALFCAAATQAQNSAPSTVDTRASVDPLFAPFYHGVASGDPLSDRIIIWTRLSDYPTASETVNWEMALDTSFTQVIANGNATADSVNDYCVKVDVTGLLPNTYYYYRFKKDGRNSLTGRTHTLPVGDNDSVRFALMSCQSYEAGYYNAHASIVNRNDIDAVLFVGDYIYEYEGFGDNRPTEPEREITTLSDYRIRHSYYKLDADLRRSMQQFPYICVWDDHEIANDGWTGGAENHTEGTEGQWVNRRAWALKTYYDWMPVRMPDPTNEPQRIYRSFRYGNLIDLLMLDTRYEGRDEQVGIGQQNADTNRTILGPVQRNWLLNQLDTTTCQWKVLGQQVMMAPLKVFGQAVNMDQWDGYPADRNRVEKHVMDNNINNFVVLTGDIHTAWANDLPQDGVSYNSNTGAGSVGVEFVCSSVTSSNTELGQLNTVGSSTIKLLNPHMKYIDLANHGYTIIDINKNRTQGEFYAVAPITAPSMQASYSDGWYVNNNGRSLVHASTVTTRVPANPPLAPFTPNQTTGVKEEQTEAVIFGVYPNPAEGSMVVQYHLYKNQNVVMNVYDIQGKQVKSLSLGKRDKGLNYTELDLSALKAGTYVLSVQTETKAYKRFIVKL